MDVDVNLRDDILTSTKPMRSPMNSGMTWGDPRRV